MQTDKTSKLGVIAFGKIKQFEKKIKELEERIKALEANECLRQQEEATEEPV